MVVWTETPDTARYAVAIYNCHGKPESQPLQLDLSVGDTVHILRQFQGDWYYGYLFKNRKKRGVFPKSYVRLKEATITKMGSYETISPKEAPIVQEITAVLREWGAIWKDLYIKMSRKNEEGMATFEKIWKMMDEIIDQRKRAMQLKLTVDEMKELKQNVTNMIDMGNAKLGLDLVVRDGECNVIDPLRTSTVHLFRQGQRILFTLKKQGIIMHPHLIQHEIATQRIEEAKQGILPGSSTQRSSSFNLFVNIKGFVCNVGDNADMLISLYDAKLGRFISESYIAKYGDKGLPRNIEMLHNMKILFTDLGQKDISRERVFIVCQIIRLGRMLISENENKKETNQLKRPFGVAAIDISELIKSNCDSDEKQLFIPLQPCGERETLDVVIKKVTAAREINHKGQGVYASVRKIHGDLQQVQKEYPHLVAAPTAISRKMGFPDVIMPDDVRNDLYVTLQQGEFRKGYGLSKTQDKNIDVTMEVCNQHGDVIPDVICEGAGGERLSQYKSIIYYHEDKPKWCETVQVALPFDDFYGSHLKFQFKHRSSVEAKDKQERPFAVSYLRLMHDNGTVVANDTHGLLVYRIDHKIKDKKLTYLKVPSTVKELENRHHIGSSPPPPQNRALPPITSGALTVAYTDTFQISTLVCSTKLPHNLNLIGLLKWKDNQALLKNHLLQFMSVDGEEIVKFLQDVLDSLFNIFMQNSDTDMYDNLVFEALIFLVNLVNDRKYSQFRSVLDVYIRENFSATLAYNKLIVVLKDYVTQLEEVGNYDSVLKTMKSLEYIFKFIIRSRLLFAALNQQKGKQQFQISLTQVFEVLGTMMTLTSDRVLLIQGACLKYMPLILTDIIAVFSPQELSFLVMELVKKIPPRRLIRQKLQFISDLVQSDIFTFPECRRIMLRVMTEELGMFLEKEIEVEFCFKILTDIMHFLYGEDPASTFDDIVNIMMQLLRTVIQTIIQIINVDRSSPIIANAVATLTAILRQMTESHYKKYLEQFDIAIDLQDFLLEILLTVKDLVVHNVFPSDWNEMIMLQNSVYLKAMRHFSNIIKERFTNPFQLQLWQFFFEAAISYITQDPLQLENFSQSKRHKIISRYKDMRREVGLEIYHMWFSLGQHKLHFIPGIVGPMIQMTLIPETELRKSTIPIFFDMMQCEYTSLTPSRAPRNNFHKFENELITQLDRLIEQGRGDVQYKELFYSIIREMSLRHETMRQDGLVFVEMVKDLLQRLLEYRAVMDDENKDNRMSCVVGLLSFYQECNRQELYVSNLHKLAKLHLESENYTEAAHTLMLYAKLLHWTEAEVPAALRSPKNLDNLTQRQLKERIYYEIIGYFDRGMMWENGIELCKELATLYETEIFDYNQLSTILTKQASFYDNIMKKMRTEPEYFRVGYYGMGFPSFLQNKSFVYRGKDYEKLTEFSARRQNMFPNAQIMTTLNPPTEEMKKSNNQYLQINAVNPVMDTKPSFKKKRVHDQILKHYRVNEVQTFSFSRKREESGSDMAKMWLDRTSVIITHKLPGILRWFPVSHTQTVEISPLENAIETMESTNRQLQSLIDQHDAEHDAQINSLSMVLNGVVDAAVNGGITNFKVFYQEQYLKENPSHVNLVNKIKEVTSLQVLLLQLCLDIHRKRAPESLMPFQAFLDQRFSQMKVFIQQDYGIQLTAEKKQQLALKHMIPLKRIQTMASRKVHIPGRVEKSTSQASTGPQQGSPSANKKMPPTMRSVSSISRSSSIPTISSNSTKVFTRGPTVHGTKVSQNHLDISSSSPHKEYSHHTGQVSARLTDGEGGKLTPSRPPRPLSSRISTTGEQLGSRPNSGSYTPPRVGQQNSISPDKRVSGLSVMSSTSVDTLTSLSTPGNRGSGDSFHGDSNAAAPPLPSKHINGDESKPTLPSRRKPSIDKPPPPLPTQSLPPIVPPKKATSSGSKTPPSPNIKPNITLPLTPSPNTETQL